MPTTAGAVKETAPRSFFLRGIAPGVFPWLGVFAVAAACLTFRDQLLWLSDYPEAWIIPMDVVVNAFMSWFVDSFKDAFRAISWLLSWPLVGLQSLLQALPWTVTVVIFSAIAFSAGGLKLTAFTVAALLYMVVTGYWRESMNTLALVGVSVPISVIAGFGIGTWAFISRRVDRVVQPSLDLMQTVPAFAYLIPILLLFGFGPVVGLIASAIYAMPPMVRNTILGLRSVFPEVVESAIMSGATRWQRFWLAEVPTALPQLMVGVNQTIMAALSMVIIAAIIGGFDDIGWEVLTTMRKAQFGPSLLSGLVIAFLAMILDRISWGFSRRAATMRHSGVSARFSKLTLAGMALTLLVTALAARELTALDIFPKSLWVLSGDRLSEGITYLTANYEGIISAVKRSAFLYLLLPLRIGFDDLVNTATWGFELTPELVAAYVAIIGLIASGLYWRLDWRPAITVVILAAVLYFGTTGTPWAAFVFAVTLLAWQVGGIKVATFSFLSMLFILVNGLWSQAMLSVYLCGAAVLVCFVLGTGLGIWAAYDARFSAFIRPINDTLQTMPQFVFLIPVLIFFQIGDFSAFLAIIAYAIVPAIRYTEHGLRHVPAETVEAARAMGATPWQILWNVKMPMAVPQIMLGLNQTILYGLAMLVIAALVGTKGLGQQVYIALGKADAGLGVIAGISIALVAMVADRIIQAWSSERKAALGIV